MSNDDFTATAHRLGAPPAPWHERAAHHRLDEQDEALNIAGEQIVALRRRVVSTSEDVVLYNALGIMGGILAISVGGVVWLLCALIVGCALARHHLDVRAMRGEDRS